MLIPLPFVTATVSALLALRLVAVRAMPLQARVLLGLLAALSAAGSLLVGLRFGYGVEWVSVVHRLVPLFIGPCLYLGFEAMGSAIARARVALHFAVAIGAAALFSIWVAALDLAIAVSYVAYWGLLFRRHLEGMDTLSALPTSVTEQMHRWRRGALVLLAAIFVLETAIALSFAFGLQDAVPQIIGYGSLPITAALLLAALNVPVAARSPATPGPTQDDLADIDAYLTSSEAFRDPDLSLNALARGLGQPIKSVSQRVNQATGQSVSLYINKRRIQAAAAQLLATQDKVEVVGQDCGFLSRSNFYREFQRIHGMTPAAYRKEARANQA